MNKLIYLHEQKGFSDRLIIGYDTGSGDYSALTTGRVNQDGSLTILNTYYNSEAEELCYKLTHNKER